MSLILNGTDGLSDVDGSASTPAVRGTDTNTGIFFPAADTIAFAEGGAEVARFDSSGNLGIGTSSPVSLLDVRGKLSVSNNSASYWQFDRNDSDGSLQFIDTATERMRIDSSGNLMVNTTSQVASCKFSVLSTNNLVGLKLTNTEGVMIDFRDSANDQCGYIYTIAGSNSTTYATSSDYRLKENTQPMTGALEKVSALKPVTFTWKKSGLDGQGFIAHELQEVCPDAVVGEKDAVDANGNPVYQGIDTSFLVATLTAAIQEQQAIITDLKSRIEALEQA
jgi:hypothetical protein